MEQILNLWLIGSTIGFVLVFVVALWHDRAANSFVHMAVSLALYPVAFAAATTALLPSLTSLLLLFRGFYTYPHRPLNTPPSELNWLDRQLVSFLEFVQNPLEPMGAKPAWQTPPAEPEPESALNSAPSPPAVAEPAGETAPEGAADAEDVKR
jgi:hypothetical protein